MNAVHKHIDGAPRREKREAAAPNPALDALILALIALAILYMRRFAIPRICADLEISAEAARIEFSFSGLFRAVLQSSPSGWFRMNIASLPLPDYPWYTALLLAATAQAVTWDVQSYLGRSWLQGRGWPLRIASSVLLAGLLTEFMFSLMMLAMLTICPQDLPPVLLLIEVICMCLPAAIHAIVRAVRGPRTFSPLELLPGVANIALIYLFVEHALICELLLFASCCAGELRVERMAKSAGWFDARRSWLRLLGLSLSAAWILWCGVNILSIAVTHRARVEVKVEPILVRSMDARGHNARLIRTDGTAVDERNQVLLTDVEQIALCDSNDFYLLRGGRLVACDAPGALPAAVLEGIRWIDAYSDALIAVDEAGDLWGFGDMTGYLPGGSYCGAPTRIAEGLGLVRADIGRGHILMLDGQGSLYGMGENSVGELGIGETSLNPQGPRRILSGIADAKAGLGVSYALSADGVLYGWGRNDTGQLGTDVQIAKYTLGRGYAVNTGMVYAADPVEIRFCDAPIRQIAAGAECCYAVDGEDRLWVWGKNIGGESITSPRVYADEVRWICDNKYQAGVTNQYTFFIGTDEEAYLLRGAGASTPEERTRQLILSEEPWIEDDALREVNSRLTRFLEGLTLFEAAGPGPEENAPEPWQTILRAPRRADNALSAKTFEGHTYRVYGEYMYQKNAESYCESMGGHLLTITSRGEYDFARAMAADAGDVCNAFSIALKYDDGLYWLNGEPTDFIDSLNITPAFDSPLGEGHIDRLGRVNVGAMLKVAFICEWDYE